MGKESVTQSCPESAEWPRQDKPKKENPETHRNQTEKIKDKEKY